MTVIPFPHRNRVTLAEENAADAAIHSAAHQAFTRLMHSVDGPYGQEDAQRVARDALLSLLLREMHQAGQIDQDRWIIQQ